MYTARIILLICSLFAGTAQAQAPADQDNQSGSEPPPTLRDDLFNQLSGELSFLFKCDAAYSQLIYQHDYFKGDHKKKAQDQQSYMKDVIAKIMVEFLAQGKISHEEGQIIESYFYAVMQPLTAAFAASNNPADLKLNPRQCLAVAQKFSQQQ